MMEIKEFINNIDKTISVISRARNLGKELITNIKS